MSKEDYYAQITIDTVIKNKQFMSLNCVKCKTVLEKAVVLVCDHQLCIDCTNAIKKPEGVPPLDAKFRIICPKCDKNTLTHNVENLINQDADKFLFENLESS